MMRKFFGIKTKIMLGTIVVMTIGVFIYLSIIIPRVSTFLKEEKIARLEKETSLYSSKVSDTLSILYGDVILLGQTPPIQGIIRARLNDGFDDVGNSSYEQWKERLEAIFIAQEEAKGLYHDIRYINEYGDEMVRVNIRDGIASAVLDEGLQNKAERYYFSESVVLPEGSVYVSELDLNREGSPPEIEIPYHPVIRYAYPVYDSEGVNKGVVVATINATRIFETLDSELQEEFIILDDNGYYLRHPDKNKEWGGSTNLGTGENIQIDYPVVWADIVANSADSLVFDNVLFVYNAIYVDRDGAKSIVFLRQLDLNVLFAEIDSVVSVAVIVAMLVAFSIVLTMYYVLRKVTKPFDEIVGVTEKIGAGDFTSRIPVNSNDELGRISQAINQMSVQLSELYTSLDSKVKESTNKLENKVSEITTVNSELEETKKAMLNILEDVENERKVALKLAADLKKFKLAVDEASDHIVITDPDGVIVYANTGAATITGYSISEMVGKKAGAKELWGGLMDAEFYKNMWKTIKVDKKVFKGEIINRRKNGKEYTAYSSITPVTDENGDLQFFLGIERDISREKAIDKAKTEFVSLASHQLRTPLSTINWYTEMTLDEDAGDLNSNQKSYLQEVYKASKRMVSLVNALLNVSRIELGTFQIEPEKTDIVKVVRSVLDELKLHIDNKKLKIKFTKSVVPEVNVDPKLIRIVYQNLLTNAVKYTPESGEISIHVDMKLKASLVGDKKIKNDSIVFVVKDTGYGIPLAQQDKIFTKLFRADNVKEKDTDGTGLGLYIVKSIVEQSEGEIWFESKENKGTTFYVVIPTKGMKPKKGSKALT